MVARICSPELMPDVELPRLAPRTPLPKLARPLRPGRPQPKHGLPPLSLSRAVGSCPRVTAWPVWRPPRSRKKGPADLGRTGEGECNVEGLTARLASAGRQCSLARGCRPRRGLSLRP